MVLSSTRHSVRLHDGTIVDRHVNHIWRSGGNPPITRRDKEDDNWLFYEGKADIPHVNTYLAVATVSLEQSSSTRHLGERPRAELTTSEDPITSATPERPRRTSVPPRRWIRDPRAKFTRIFSFLSKEMLGIVSPFASQGLASYVFLSYVSLFRY